MAIKLFKKNEKDIFAKLDKLMRDMADTKTYLEYIKIRGGM